MWRHTPGRSFVTGVEGADQNLPDPEVRMADSASAAARGGVATHPILPPPPSQARVTPALEPPLVRPLRPVVARRILAGAIGLGLLFQALFVGQLAGLNVPLWVAGVIATGWLLAPRPSRVRRSDVWLPAAALTFAALVAVRANPALVTFDLAAAVALTAASLAAFAGAAVTTRSLAGLSLLVGQGLALTAAGTLPVGPARRGLRGTAPALSGGGRAVLAGMLLAVPLVAMFAILFASADAVFGSMVAGLADVRPDLGDVPGRMVVAAAVAWCAGGLLVLVVAATRRVRREPAPLGLRLGPVEATVVLVAVDLVFAAFVAIQAGYLFGGMDTAAASGLGYAQYARRGFFELVAVAALAGAVVVALESVVADRRRAYRVAAIALVALTGVVLLSAGVRMALYQDAFGWSELRFFVVAAIAWLALCLVAAAVGIATGRSRALPAAIGVLGLVVALGVNLVDPGSFIAEQNLRRAADPAAVPTGGSTGLDVAYLAGLGPDAVPALVSALPTLPPQQRAAVEAALEDQRAALQRQVATSGWPSWNRSRERALAALAPLTGP